MMILRDSKAEIGTVDMSAYTDFATSLGFWNWEVGSLQRQVAFLR